MDTPAALAVVQQIQDEIESASSALADGDTEAVSDALGDAAQLIDTLRIFILEN